MRLTVLGRSPASPNPGEACAGYLVEGGGARLLVDIGPGVVAQLVRRHHPDELDAVVISHMHADHMLDLVTLRYVYPWRERPKDQRLRVFLPPGSADQVLDLAKGVGNARHFESSFRLAEHDGSSPLPFAGLTMTPGPDAALHRLLGIPIRGRWPPPRLHGRYRPQRWPDRSRRPMPTCFSARRPCGRSRKMRNRRSRAAT